MIISHINGGLGNQLFQYAAGRTLALRLGMPLALDLRHYEGDVLHGFGLSHFNAQFCVAAQEDLPPNRQKSPFSYLLWRGLRLSPRLFRESELGYNEAFTTLSTAVYLKGYWQSERYFRDYAATIRADLQIVTPPDAENQRVLNELQDVHSVSVHIRRGDYVLDAATNATHGTCTLDYYIKATRLIAERTGKEPVVYAFSDDPDWVAENLKLPFEMRLMRHNNTTKNHEDLRLMSACRHNIIANSSFSWWGTWLNPSPDKIVVAPKKWFAKPDMHNPDILPVGWIRM